MVDTFPDPAEPAPSSGPSRPNIHSCPAPRLNPAAQVPPALPSVTVQRAPEPAPGRPQGPSHHAHRPPDMLPAEGRPQPVHSLARQPGPPAPACEEARWRCPGKGGGVQPALPHGVAVPITGTDSFPRGAALRPHQPRPLSPTGRALWGRCSGMFSLPGSPNFRRLDGWGPGRSSGQLER